MNNLEKINLKKEAEHSLKRINIKTEKEKHFLRKRKLKLKKEAKHSLKKRNSLKKDNKGQIFSTDLLIGIILLIFIIGTIANITEKSHEKLIDKVALTNLEEQSIEAMDYLIKNPGNPEDWENNIELNNGIVNNDIIPGLAIKNKNIKNGQFEDESNSPYKITINTISYEKIIKIQTFYKKLIDENLFNNSLKSSIAIYPVNSKIQPIICGDNLDNEDSNVVNVERLVKCNFLRNLVIYDFNDLELQGRNYTRDNFCNHDNIVGIGNHSNNQKSIWLCKNFRIYKNSLEDYNYYLISSDSINNFNCYWLIENLNKTTDRSEKLNKEIIDLNPLFEEDLKNTYETIYSIHFKIPKTNANEFNSCLVAIPNNLTENEIINENTLKYDYFKNQDVRISLKTSYK